MHLWNWLDGVERGKGKERRTDAMKRPKAPPSAKPITPETAVFPGQDSMSICIYFERRISLLFNHLSLSFL